MSVGGALALLRHRACPLEVWSRGSSFQAQNCCNACAQRSLRVRRHQVQHTTRDAAPTQSITLIDEVPAKENEFWGHGMHIEAEVAMLGGTMLLYLPAYALQGQTYKAACCQQTAL